MSIVNANQFDLQHPDCYYKGSFYTLLQMVLNDL